MLRFLLCGILNVALSCIALAQTLPDTTFRPVAANNTLRLYDDFISVHSGLINGSEYVQPRMSEEQYPFYKHNDWLTGDVRYHGFVYKSVSLMYDIANDQLVLENPTNAQELQLVRIKVAYFTLEDEEFVFRSGSSLAGLPQEGFYQRLYQGPSEVLARHNKTFEEKIVNRELIFLYSYRQRIYLRSKSAQYLRVSRKKDILKVFSDRKDEVRDFMRTNRLKLNKNNPQAFARVAGFYDSL